MFIRTTTFKFIATIVGSVILSYSISFISGKVNVLDKFAIAITDVDFSDFYYHYRPKPKADENIVIINVGYLDRSKLARLLRIVSDNKPKVIGGDVFFSQENDSLDIIGTRRLSDEVKSISNLILASSYWKDGNVVAGQSPLIRRYVKEGLLNWNVAADDPEYGTVRSFEPITDVDGVKYLSFGFFVASFFDSTVLANAYEGDMMIKWYGYANRSKSPDHSSIFKTFDWDQIQAGEFNRSDIEGKIVLFGFMGSNVGDYSIEDNFYSPLNKKVIGRSSPDIYGVEIHANIIKMIIDNDYIYHSKVTDYAFNLAFISAFTLALFWLHRKYQNQYSLLSKVTLILFVDILVVGTIAIFFWTSGAVKFLIADGLFIMLFLPDTYEFLENNLFNRIK